MINSVVENELVLTSNTDSIAFPTDVVRTCSANCCGWLQHDTGSSQYQITKGGVYEILFSTNITSATSGQVALTIENNGEPLTGTQMDATIATAGEYTSISTNRLVRVCNGGNANITITSLASINSTATQVPIVKNSSLIIKRIC